ncbi:HAD family hydrolase [Micromonospora echinospora]|uniref:HAD family hydrolase n=1 Tax=Micromonospora echinospora TaxID=1877 RepID=UPI0033E6F356
MPLLLIDLDNTLIDRTEAFRRWAQRYVDDIEASEADADWLSSVERDGYTPRIEVAEAMRTRWGIEASIEEIVEDLLLGHLVDIELDKEVVAALDRATRLGWHPVVVTNGTTRQQELKLGRTGLDQHVRGWVISEAVGVSKPHQRIFALAGELAGLPLQGGWMIGDHPLADVGGGHAAGLSTVWLRRGRTWPSASPQPTCIADSFPQAIDLVLTGGEALETCESDGTTGEVRTDTADGALEVAFSAIPEG